MLIMNSALKNCRRIVFKQYRTNFPAIYQPLQNSGLQNFYIKQGSY